MSKALVDSVMALPEERRRAWVASLDEYQRRSLAVGKAWWFFGRPEQHPPPGRWRYWLITAGRGFGKTRSGAEWAAAKARRFPGALIGLVAISFGDGRDTMVEGESGLLSVFDPSELRGGNVEAAWNRSMGELFLANGSRFKIYSSERPRQLRGPQFHFIWGDEPAYWLDAAVGTARDSTFSNTNIALRLPPRRGWESDYRPQGVLTTTPRRVPLLKIPDQEAAEHPDRAGLYQRPDVIMTLGSTMDNIQNLDAEYRAEVIDPMIGTTLGRQELGGELLEDVEGALWTQALLDATRLLPEAAPAMSKRVVGFDPSGGGGRGHDEMGIVVAGIAGERKDAQLFIERDLSINTTPVRAAARAIAAYYEYGCQAIVYEKNQGQDWIPTVFESTFDLMVAGTDKTLPKLPDNLIRPNLQPVNAVKSKYARAKPVAGLYEQKRVHHLGTGFPILEGQMTTWIPDDGLASPDRLDALVWAITWLYAEGPNMSSVASAARRENRRGGRRADQPNTRLPTVYNTRRSGR